jgi:AraC-like DNA-binding protein
MLWASSGYSVEPLPPDIHIHRGMELGILLTGIEEVHYESTVLTCQPGDVWLCSAYEPHGARLVSPPRRSVVLIFLPEFLGRERLGELAWPTMFALAPDQRPRASTPQVRRRVLEIGQVLRREIEEMRPRWESVVRLEAVRLLIELSRQWKVPAQAEPPGGRAAKPARAAAAEGLERVLPALSLVHSLPWRKVRVAEAAASCSLGSSRFQALFRRTMGVSFGEFALRARVTSAANRLAETSQSISAIASESGFVDGSHFHRHFVRLYGCTPAQYRGRAAATSGGERSGTPGTVEADQRPAISLPPQSGGGRPRRSRPRPK